MPLLYFTSHSESIGLRLFADRYVRYGKDISKCGVQLSASVAYDYQQVWRTIISKCGVRLSASVAYG